MDVKEIWKKIKKLPYEISNYGKIRRAESYNSTYVGKVLKQSLDRDGYLKVILYKNGKMKTIKIHRLVAEAFLGPCPDGKEVNHIDGNKENPHVDNLEYVTKSENSKHAFKLGLQDNKGEKHPSNKLKEKDVLKIRRIYKTGNYYQRELAKNFNCSQAHISEIINNKRWKHIA